MTDLPLFAHALARRSDHTSSRDAADRALRTGLVAGHEGRILRALRESGCAMTLRHLADATGLDHVAVARRMAGLVRRGMVRRIALEKERLRWVSR